MEKTDREVFDLIVHALENNSPDDDIRKLVEDAYFDFDNFTDESGHNLIFYFEKYERDDLWENMVAEWESDYIAAAMEDYDAARKPFYG